MIDVARPLQPVHPHGSITIADGGRLRTPADTRTGHASVRNGDGFRIVTRGGSGCSVATCASHVGASIECLREERSSV